MFQSLILLSANFHLLPTHCYGDTSPRPCITLLTRNLHDAAGSRCNSVFHLRAVTAR